MSWISIALIGYLFLAVEAVITKMLLVARIKNWQTYSFLVGIFSFFSLIFWPLAKGGWGEFSLLAIISGLLLFLSLIFLYQALEKNTASRVFSLYGGISTLFVLILSHFFFSEKWLAIQLGGVLLLAFGGLFISFKFEEKRIFSGFREVVLSSIIFAFSLVFLKIGYLHQDFWAGYVYSRLGIGLGAVLFFSFPFYREVILANFQKKTKKKNAINFLGVVSAKILAGTGTILINWAVALGSVAVISALASAQLLFTFLLAVLLSGWFPSLKENITRKKLFYKIIGVILIISGMLLVN